VASKSLEEWLKILWENEYVVRGVVCGTKSSFVCSTVPLCVSPPRLGVRPPFYRSRGRRVTCALRYLAMWRSATCYGVEWAAVRAIFAAIWSSWPDLYPNSGGSRVGEQQMAVMSSGRLEGGADASLYGVQG
jgi:hypothetical protein